MYTRLHNVQLIVILYRIPSQLIKQQEQKAEEDAHEVDFKQRVDRLREACRQRASTLRRCLLYTSDAADE